MNIEILKKELQAFADLDNDTVGVTASALIEECEAAISNWGGLSSALQHALVCAQHAELLSADMIAAVVAADNDALAAAATAAGNEYIASRIQLHIDNDSEDAVHNT